MAKFLDITLFGEELSNDFKKSIEYAKEVVPGLKVNLLSAPFFLNYSVPSPIVIFKENNSGLSLRGYGSNGLSLINEVIAGKL